LIVVTLCSYPWLLQLGYLTSLRPLIVVTLCSCPWLLQLEIVDVWQIHSSVVELTLQPRKSLLIVVRPLAGFALPEIEIAQRATPIVEGLVERAMKRGANFASFRVKQNPSLAIRR
jgi:hypothetical protein